MNLILIITIAASVYTAIAGILHLSILPTPYTNSTRLFFSGGIAKYFDRYTKYVLQVAEIRKEFMKFL